MVLITILTGANLNQQTPLGGLTNCSSEPVLRWVYCAILGNIGHTAYRIIPDDVALSNVAFFVRRPAVAKNFQAESSRGFHGGECFQSQVLVKIATMK